MKDIFHTSDPELEQRMQNLGIRVSSGWLEWTGYSEWQVLSGKPLVAVVEVNETGKVVADRITHEGEKTLLKSKPWELWMGITVGAVMAVSGLGISFFL
jgi:hypothetical protein